MTSGSIVTRDFYKAYVGIKHIVGKKNEEQLV